MNTCRAWPAESTDVATMMGSFAHSPMQHIQRDFLEATDFFVAYQDHQKEMRFSPNAWRPLRSHARPRRRITGRGRVVGRQLRRHDHLSPLFRKRDQPWLRKAGAVQCSG